MRAASRVFLHGYIIVILTPLTCCLNEWQQRINKCNPVIADYYELILSAEKCDPALQLLM